MATEKVDILQVNTEPSRTSVKDLRKEMKSLKDQLLNLDEGTAEYNATLQKAANIQHTLKEQMEEVNASAMDAGQILGNATNAVAGMTGAFQAGAGIMNMFGVESEASMEMIAKMQNVMAITQGFQAIDDGVKAFGRLGTAIKGSTIWQALFGKQKKEEVKDQLEAAAATTTYAGSQKLAESTTKKTTTATHGFKKALIATGLGALVVILGSIIANWDEFTQAIGLSGEQLKKLKQVYDGVMGVIQNGIKHFASAITKLVTGDIDGAMAEFKQAIDVKAAYVESVNKGIEEDNAKAAQKAAEKRSEDLKNQIAMNEAKLGDQYKFSEKGKKDYVAYYNALMTQYGKDTQEYKDAKIQKVAYLKEYNDQQVAAEEELKKKIQAVKDSLNDYFKTDQQRETDNLKAKYDEQKALLVGNETELLRLEEWYKAESKKITEKYDKQAEDKTKATNDKILSTYQSAEDLKLKKQQYALEQKRLLEMEAYANGTIDKEKYLANIKKLDDEAQQNELTSLEAQLANVATFNLMTEQQQLDLKNKILAIKKKQGEDTVKTAETTAKAEKEIEAEKMKTILAIAGALSGALAGAADLAKEGSKEQKNLKIAASIIDTISGGISAYMSAQSLPTPFNFIVGATNAATVLAAGFANIKKMKSINVGGDSGGGQSIPSVSLAGLAASQAPVQATTQVTGASTEAAMKDNRVYVVESDITNTQRKVSTAEAEATF